MRAAALLLAGLLLGCNGLFYHPTRLTYVQPERLGIAYTDHVFRTADGTPLHGRLHHRKEGTPALGLFVLFHGNAQNLTAHFLQFAWVTSRGYDLFVFDYPGYGRSGGEASRKSSLAGGAAALDFVADSLWADTARGRLVLVGESLGGAILLRNFVDWKARDRAALVVAESTFPAYRSAARSALAGTWLTWPLQPLAYVLISGHGSPAERIREVSPTPLLVVYCEEDRAVAPRLTREVYRLARDPKVLWAEPGCGHIQAFKAPANRERLLGLVDSLPARPPAGERT